MPCFVVVGGTPTRRSFRGARCSLRNYEDHPKHEKSASERFFELRLMLERAVKQERYKDAAKLKSELSDCRERDPLLKTRDQLQSAVDNEDYEAAAQLRDRLRAIVRERPKAAEKSLNRLMHVNVQKEGSRIISTAADGSFPYAHTKFSGENAAFVQPTWSPSGDFMAFSWFSVNIQTRSLSCDLVVRDVLEGKEVAKWSLKDVPFYFYWSPCSRYLTFLSADHGALTMRGASIEPVEAPVVVDNGGPFFYHFNPNFPSLMVTHNKSRNTVEVFNVRKDPQRKKAIVLTSTSGAFQAPQWLSKRSRKGGDQVLFVEEVGDENVLWCIDVETKEKNDLFRSAKNSVINFSAAPDSSKVAILVRSERTERFVINEGPIDTVDYPDDDKPVAVDLGLPLCRTLAYFWSPDAKKLLFLTYNGENMNIARWNVYDFSSGTLARFEEHQPGALFVSQYLPFFEQYALSHSIWSPDSAAFCYAATTDRLGKNAPPFSWVQRLPREMLDGFKEESGRERRRVITADQTSLPEPVLRDSAMCTWSK
mmetsp:Transcript_300/g.980  ORF Transcript_300/g.980 Transcript_300/m.980 type:complete len:537 (-) Transcript_300:26-1636(-)